nr:LysM peptidoglycan-binding domain-containing protein [Anaerolineae bacterium]
MRRRILIILSLMLFFVVSLPVSAQGGADGQTTIHVVQRGENLFRIALAYGTSVESIAQTNSLSNVTSIQVGQRLVIPSGIVNAEIATASRHIVQPGETLQHVALRHGSTKAIVAALNNIINPNQLLVGQVLDVSQSAAGQQPLSRGYTYTVKTSDTLYQIAARYRASIGTLLRTNNLKSATLIYPGQQLLIPGGDDAPALQVLPAPLEELNINPLPVEVGRTFRVRVVSSQPISISGTFLDRTFQFAATDGSSTYIGLFGVHAFAIPGLYPLTLSIRDADGSETAFTSQIRVANGRYQSEEINVPADQLALLDPNLNSAETALLTRTMSNFTAQRYFDGPLGLPAAA